MCMCLCASMTKSKVRQDIGEEKKKGHEIETMIDRLNKTQTREQPPCDGCKNFPKVCQRQQNPLVYNVLRGLLSDFYL